ncbi:MAG: sulfatase-like hydrolase/transferase [Lachnospiraceae bacterium]|nr:sulfatase-like hydrolase/transferase [Lachnospiraceae bacterium]
MKTTYKNILSALFFPATIFYYEMIFRESTVHGIWGISFYPTLLFSLLYGGFLFLILSLIKNKRIYFTTNLSLLCLTAIPFLVEFFVYRQFKIFYDLNTVAGGAGDVAGGFMDDVLRLIFSFDGLYHIFLFLLPAVLYGIFGRKQVFIPDFSEKLRHGTIFTLAALFIVTLFTVNFHKPFSNAYDHQYSFQSAVSNFGLITGIRLDATRNISGDDGGFEAMDMAALEETIVESEIEKEIVETEPEYGDSIMNIDFKALAEQSSGVYAEMDNYVASLQPSSKNKYTGIFEGKNLIFITAEAFSEELIDPELTPTLYRLATKGIHFTDYYQPASAGTIGGEFSNIFGMLPMNGGISFENMAYNHAPFTMGQQLNKLGYYGVAYHNNDYTYYSRHITHNSLGYSEGFYGMGNGLEEHITYCFPESDLELIEATIDDYIDHQPFNIYYMSVSGHSEYTNGSNAMANKNQDAVAHMTDVSDRIRNYYACNLEFEYAMTYLIDQLEAKGIADDTVIVIGADHFPYGLDYDAALGYMPYLEELYGHEVNTYLERDHNRLIIWSGCLEDSEPIVVDTPTSSIDILPTLSNLFGLEWDSRLLVGRDVFSDAMPLVFTVSYDWKTDKGTYLSWSGTFTPADANMTIPSDYVDRINSIVRNKLTFSSRIINYDYYAHIFTNEIE